MSARRCRMVQAVGATAVGEPRRLFGATGPGRSLAERSRWVNVRLTVSVGIVAAIVAALLASPAHAADLGRCSQVATEAPYLLVRCEPGFGAPSSRIAIFTKDRITSWLDPIAVQDATWLVYPDDTERVGLVIVFGEENGQYLARLYDDQSGDGNVSLGFVNGLPVVTELPGLPTIVVRSPHPWPLDSQKPNLNLDITVDGSVKGMIDAPLYESLLRTDGKPDLEIHVRDLAGDGRPDFEWRQAYAPLPDDSGYYRTSVMVNPLHNEAYLASDFPWPYVGSITYDLVKPYLQSPAPIQVDWAKGRITQVGEFVASRGANTYFIYSVRRIAEGQISDPDFESPFAFYNLSGVPDGMPDLAVRHVYWPPRDSYLSSGRVDSAVVEVDYSWTQQRRRSQGAPVWDYYVGLAGRNVVTSVVSLPELGGLRIPSYSDLPALVTGQRWDYMTFVAREGEGYASSEGIYEWNPLEGAAPESWAYVTGSADRPPWDAFAHIRSDFRGEYTSRNDLSPDLYFSPIDGRLHLRFADAGVWNVSSNRLIRYQNLGGEYINRWSAVVNGAEAQSLTYAAGELVLSDSAGVRLRTAGVPPAVFTARPPTNHDEWVSLGEHLQGHRVSFAGDDLDAMFSQFTSPVQAFPGAAVRDLRLTADGFRFVLDVSGRAAPAGAPWAASLGPGSHVVHYRSGFGYSAVPLTPPRLELSGISAGADRAIALSPLELSVAVANRGGEDVSAAVVTFTARRDGGAASAIGSARFDVAADTTSTAQLEWAPPTAGTWQIGATVRPGEGTTTPLDLVVVAAPATDLRSLLTAQMSRNLAVVVTALLVTTAAVGGGLGFIVWGGAASPSPRAEKTDGDDR